MRKRKAPYQEISQPLKECTRLKRCHAVVIGAGSVGRQVAMLLGCLGVRHLSLYDSRLVTEGDLDQGFLDYDLGTPAVDAVANSAHQHQPQMELLTYQASFRQSHLTSWKKGSSHAVFLCDAPQKISNSLWKSLINTASFLCVGQVVPGVIKVISVEKSAQAIDYPSMTIGMDGTQTADIVSATLAAGLMVEQFTHWVRRLPCIPIFELHLNNY